MQPEMAFYKLRKGIRREWILCIVSVFVFGLLAHSFKFTNFIPNWDSVLNLNTDQNKINLGRCFLQAACSLGSYYDLPWINGLLSLLYISLSAVCVSEVFQIRKTIPLVLLGGLMVTFPTVTSTFAYQYTADGYFLALLCVSGATLLAVRGGKMAILPSAALLAFSLGIYQTYITFAMVLMLLFLVDQLLFQQMSIRSFWKTAGKFAATGVLGAAGYMICMKVMTALEGIGLSHYQGIESAYSMESLNLMAAVKRALYRFLIYFLNFSEGINLSVLLNMILWVLLAVLLVAALVKQQLWKEPARILLILLCIGLLPLASFALYFATPDLDYHNLMRMCLCLIYMIPLIFYERMEKLLPAALQMKQWSILVLTSLVIYNFILLANISYQKMHMAYEKSYGVAIRIADRIEQTPGATDCRKIAVLGHLPGSQAISVNFPLDMTGITDSYIIRKQDPEMQENVLQIFLQDYTGLSFEDTTLEEIQRIQQSEEYRQMGCWPEQNGILVMGDTLVIRFAEDQAYVQQ
ncbi:MAG: glucosyltransferase domain-containing protein [Lachnospiraceae bacterium]|nr:glucosyltransferase domain-containing protein [Lachnospiraceae bacterium]